VVCALTTPSAEAAGPARLEHISNLPGMIVAELRVLATQLPWERIHHLLAAERVS
jgi:hypothetical protein